MTVFDDKVRKYNERLKRDFQINDVQACGIWGNLGTETGGFTALQEKNPTVKGSRGGYGWMQWTGPRRKKYEAWCKTKGLDAAADETNYQYLIHETLTDEWKSIQQVRKTTTIEAATETFMKLNLRPGIPHLENRYRWARKAQDALKSITVTKVAKNTTLTTVPLVGSGLLYYYWEQVMLYWPWFAGIGAAAAIALIIYLIRKNNV
jgi:hypothetical protein